MYNNTSFAAVDPYFSNNTAGGRHHPYHRRYYSKGENLYDYHHRNHRYLTMLWDQTKQLPKEAFKLVESSYEESGFYLEVRLHLAAFVESNFMPSLQVDDSTAANYAAQLLTQLDAKIAAIPTDPDKFLSKSKLQEMSDNLKVRPVTLTRFSSTRQISIS